MSEIPKVIQARSNLLLGMEFFGMLAMRLRLQEDPSCPTFWTDGITLGFNPEYSASLTMDERMGVVGHEVTHCSNGHIWRFPGTQPGFTEQETRSIWNEACDYAINQPLILAGLTLPKGALNDKRFHGKSAEEIFYTLCAQYRKDGKKPEGSGFGEIRPTPNPNDKQAEEQEWKQATLQAAQAALVKGKLPAGFEDLIESIRNPAIDWKAALRKFVEQTALNDYSWQRPNRRYLPMEMYMPCMRSDRLPPVVIGVDTSGSISDEILSQFASEITSIMSEAQPEKVIVMYCDAKVHKIEEYEPGEQIVMKAVGRGGTSFTPVLEAVAALEERVACLIYLTDGYGDFGEAIETPTLWVMTTDVEVPFGEVLRIK